MKIKSGIYTDTKDATLWIVYPNGEVDVFNPVFRKWQRRDTGFMEHYTWRMDAKFKFISDLRLK